MAEIEIDARGLYCPIPVLRLSKALAAQLPGTVVLLTATDPASEEDVEVFCRERHCELLTSVEEHGVFRFRIRKN